MTRKEKLGATTSIKEMNKLGTEGTSVKPNAWKMRRAAPTFPGSSPEGF